MKADGRQELHAGCLLGLFFDPQDRGDMFFLNIVLTFSELHGDISQKIEVFITTALGTPNPASLYGVVQKTGSLN
jgi:hypothetical protein